MHGMRPSEPNDGGYAWFINFHCASQEVRGEAAVRGKFDMVFNASLGGRRKAGIRFQH
jgi:hypothetical protein